jgi:hypothetical protein
LNLKIIFKFEELTGDEPTQQVIRTIAQTEARRRRGPGGGYFGVRDSRRQSRKYF